MKLAVTKSAAAQTRQVGGKGLTLSVTKKGTDVEAPARGFIEMKGLKVSFYTNTAKQIVGIELVTDGKKQMFKDPHPFVMWTQIENHVELYLSSLRAVKTDDKLIGIGKKRITKRKAR